jgi:pimeloyl-ACP methyl ester carboxylesterase
MRKRFVDTSRGQVHLREADGGGAALLLIHWTPLSGRMYAAVAPPLAAAGYRVLAPDLLGYGRSDPRPAEWSIEAWADSLAEVLDGLGVARAHVLGGHNGASVAVELALRHADRVGALVLDGCPLPTDELRAAFRALSAVGRPSAEAAPRLAFDRTVALLREYIPGFEVDDGTVEMVWPAMIDLLSTDFVSSGPVAGAYDLAARLPLVSHRTLLLGAERDTLAASFGPARMLLRPAASHLFDGHHPLHFPERAAEYAAIVTAFLAAGR